MKTDILIFGKGHIAQRLQAHLGCARTEKHVTTFADIEEEVKTYKPKTIINCIGHTGKNNVDDCEIVIDRTLTSNMLVPVMLAEVALRQGIKFVHIGSGCMYHYDYDKDRPISETRAPDFYALYYSRTKIYAEAVLKDMAKHMDILILRIRVPLDDRPYNKNVLTKLLQYKTIIDIPNSVTYIPDFLKAAEYLLKKKAVGIYNICCKGALRYSKLLDVYRKHVPAFQYTIIDVKQLKPRTNLILSTRKLEQTGFKVRTVNEMMQECIHNYVQADGGGKSC